MANLFTRYLARTLRYAHARFIIELALVPFPFKIAIGMLIAPLAGDSFQSTTDYIARDGMGMLIVTALILAPMVETVIGQWLPIWLVSLATKKFPWVLFISASLFTLQHIHVGWAGMLPVFPVAVALSWSFIRMRQVSRWRACWVTAAIHSLHNGVSLIFYLLADSYFF